jgi:hypothetical protein
MRHFGNKIRETYNMLAGVNYKQEIAAAAEALAGKVVSSDELKQKLAAAGYDDLAAYRHARERLIFKKEKQIRRQAEAIRDTVYMPGAAVAAIEERLAQGPQETGCVRLVTHRLSRRIDTVPAVESFNDAVRKAEWQIGEYYSAAPYLRFTATTSDKAYTRAVIKALEDCADNSARVGTDLRLKNPVIEDMRKRHAAKFES